MKSFRQIHPNNGEVTQRQLFEEHISGEIRINSKADIGDIPLDPTKVPRLVNPKQFDVITYRRRMRMCIEKARCEAGRRTDGIRQNEYIHPGRHLHALKRVRDPTGTFMKVKTETPLQNLSICNN